MFWGGGGEDPFFVGRAHVVVVFVTLWYTRGRKLIRPQTHSPIIVHRLSWRWIYYITSGVGIVAWLLLIAFVPETRYFRSDAELGMLHPPSSLNHEKGITHILTPIPHAPAGKEVYPLAPGETRPRLDVQRYGPRTKKHDFGLFHVPRAWARARRSVWDTLRTCLFPNVVWVVLVNSTFISAQGAAGQVASAVLIAAGWQFERLGLVVVPIVVASPLVWLFGGYLADRISNWHARARGGGRREPEAHLLSLVLPLLCGIVGPLLFGYAGQNINDVPAMVLLVAVFLIGFSFLTANAVFSVYLVESYPAYAG